MNATDPCPCGVREPFGRCCLPLHVGERQARTAEALMRSRYSAYVAGARDYLWTTWHPRTRPESPIAGDGLTWTGLAILDVVAGQPGDQHGEVEFRAFHRSMGDHEGHVAALHERSRFVVRAGRWFYFDGDLLG